MNRTGEIPPDSFDLVFGRFLLFQMIDPAATLRRMFEWVKPGGCLVIQDYDLAPLDIHPHQPLFAEFRRICFAVMAQTSRDIRLGMKLRTLFKDGTGGAPDATRVHAQQTTLAEAAPLIAAVYRALLPLALELGVTNDRDGVLAQRILDLPDKRGYAVLWPLLHSAWRRKPAEGYATRRRCAAARGRGCNRRHRLPALFHQIHPAIGHRLGEGIARRQNARPLPGATWASTASASSP